MSQLNSTFEHIATNPLDLILCPLSCLLRYLLLLNGLRKVFAELFNDEIISKVSRDCFSYTNR